VFNADGQITEEGTKKKLREFLAGFAGFIQSSP
jgi:hypothetical protein